jgi:N-formylglutamate amidohydrolase
MTGDTVHVLVYTHHHGEDVFAYASEEGASAAKAELARLYWDDAVSRKGADLPASADDLSDAEAAGLYFGAMADRESVSITVTTVQA